jgi:TPR repeat protein
MIQLIKYAIGKPIVPILLCLFALSTVCTAQEKTGAPIDTTLALLKQARRYHHGINRDVNLKKARALYVAAAKRNSPEALNALGLMYLNGDGIERDTAVAFRLLLKGAQLNGGSALCNLGMMYLKAKGVEQDLNKSFQYYKQAADNNYKKAYYHTGYLYYKGIGVAQSYTRAIEYFRKGAALGNAKCLYMLGCCNMYGYGIAQDVEKAKDHFTKALQRGHGWVEDIIECHTIDSLRNHPALQFESIADVKQQRLTDGKMPEITNSSSADSLVGRWTGKLYTYDWSKSSIEKEENITLEFSREGDRVNGQWYDSDRQPFLLFVAQRANQCWRIVSQQPADSSKQVKINLRSFTSAVSGRLMRGALACFSKNTKEPVRPAFFVLDRQQAIGAIDTTFIINRIYPNPVINQLHVDFTVLKADNLTFQIQGQLGVSYSSTVAKLYQPGHYSFTMNLALPTGVYTFAAFGKEYKFSQTIIKK